MAFKIFIVDDDPVMRDRLKDFLSSKYDDAHILPFSTGEAAILELFRKPDVIVLDYHLERRDKAAMNGIDILRRMKELLPHTPVIFLSNIENPEVAENTVKYGAYDYIVKNENALHRVENMINNATGHFSLHKQLKIQKVFNRIVLLLFICFLLAVLLYKFIG